MTDYKAIALDLVNEDEYEISPLKFDDLIIAIEAALIAAHDEALEEAERLRASVEDYPDVVREWALATAANQRLQSEVEQLRAQLATEVTVNADYPDVVQTMDRYRAALEEISNGGAFTITAAYDIARAALGGGK